MPSAIPILAFLTMGGAHAQLPNIQQVSARMDETRARAASQIRGYSVVRRYTLTVGRDHSAEMMVRITNSWPSRIKFEVLSERGSNTIQKRVFRRLLKAEEDAARHDARLTPANYTFTPEGMDTVNGHRCYVLRLTPRRDGKYLIRGRVWVDAAEFGIVRLEGEPVDTGSFWVASTHMVQDYRKVAGFWLPAINESDSDVRIFGRAHLRIESLDYKIDQAQTEDSAGLILRPPVE